MKVSNHFRLASVMLVVILITVHTSVGARVKFFEGKKYKGLLTEMYLNDTNTKGCIPLINSKNETGLYINSVKTNKCLILYNAPNCHSFFDIIGHPANWPDKNCEGYDRCKSTFPYASFKVKKNEADISLLTDGDSPQFVSSFHFCSDKLGGGRNPRVDIYEANNYTGTLVDSFRNVCGCRNLPYKKDNGLSRELWFDNHGNSLDLFENENCQGRSKNLRAGMGFNSLNVWKDGSVRPSALDVLFTQNAYGWERLQFERASQLNHWGVNNFAFKSIRPSGNPKCVQLEAAIHKFHIHNKTHHGKIVSLGKEVKLRDYKTWVNYRDTNVEKQYSLFKNLTSHSSLKFGMAPALREMKSAATDWNATMETDVGLPFFYPNPKMLTIFKSKYNWPASKAFTTNSSKFSIPSHHNINYNQTFQVAPCSVCKLSSFIKWSDNHPIEYTVHAKVKGSANDGNDVDSSTLIKYLPFGLKLVKVLDKNSVEVSANGTITAHGATEAYLKVWCIPIKNCEKTHLTESMQPAYNNITAHLPIQESIKNQVNDETPRNGETIFALILAKLGNYTEAINELRNISHGKYQIEDFVSELYDGEIDNTKHCLNLLASLNNCTEYGNGVANLLKNMEAIGDLTIRSVFILEWYLNNSTCTTNEVVKNTLSELNIYLKAATSYWKNEIANCQYQEIVNFAMMGELELSIVESKVGNPEFFMFGFDSAKGESFLMRKKLMCLSNFSDFNTSLALYERIAKKLNRKNKCNYEAIILAHHIRCLERNVGKAKKNEIDHFKTTYIPVGIQKLIWESGFMMKNAQCGEFSYDHNSFQDVITDPLKNTDGRLKNPDRRLKNPVPRVKNPVPRLKNPVPRLKNPVPRLKNSVPRLKNPVPRLRNPVPRLRNPVPRLRNPVPRLKNPSSPIEENRPSIEDVTPSSDAVTPSYEEDIQSFEEDTTSSDEVIQSSDEVIQSSDEVIQSSDEVIQSSDEVIQSSDEVIQSSDEVLTSSDEVLTSSDEVLTSSDEVLTSSDEVLTSSDEVLTSSDDVITSSDEVITSSDEVITSSDEVITSSDEVITSSDEVITASDEVIVSSDEVITSSDEVIVSSDEVITSSDEVLTSSDEVLTSSDEVLTSSDDVITSSNEVITSSDEVIPSSDEVTPSSDEVIPSSDEIITSSNEVTPSSDEVIPSSDEIITSSNEVITSSDEVTPSFEREPSSLSGDISSRYNGDNSLPDEDSSWSDGDTGGGDSSWSDGDTGRDSSWSDGDTGVDSSWSDGDTGVESSWSDGDTDRDSSWSDGETGGDSSWSGGDNSRSGGDNSWSDGDTGGDSSWSDGDTGRDSSWSDGDTGVDSSWSDGDTGVDSSWSGGDNSWSGGDSSWSDGDTGGDNSWSGGDNSWSGGDNSWSGGDNSWSGGDNSRSGGDNSWSGGDKSWSGGDNSWSGGDNSWSGGDNSWSGGDNSWSGGGGSWSGGGGSSYEEY